ncbi:hypothetical protein L484_025463 [Morus notabilis]|uniref:Uncharacterized protein n=1 Tax=Morus notabilis TaxID=981085 RepID=W9RNL6_9ROSA|nr:uncharacterized protein LOC21408163 [Morus notabilis]EXC01094.1 hypothetical protein L484_025463 [Morus notabilis]
MDHHDLKGSETKSNAGRTCSPQKQSLLEMANGLAYCRKGLADANVEIQKDVQNCKCEIGSCKAEKFPGIERNDRIAPSGCVKEISNDLRPSFIISTVRHSVLERRILPEGTSMVSPYRNGAGSNECLKNSEASACSAEKVTNFKKISMKFDVDSDHGQPLDRDLHAGTNGCWPNSGENGSRTVMRAVFHDKQCKTESSSSNSSHIILPSSSNDSCQDTSLDTQSCKRSKIDAMDTSTCTDLKSNLKEAAFTSSRPGRAICNPQGKLENTVSPGKRSDMVKTSETLGVRTRNGDNAAGMSSDNNYVTVENNDISKSDLFKKGNEKVDVHSKAEVLHEHGDAVIVSPTVASEAEQDFEASGSSSSAEGRNGEMLRQSYIDSVDSNRKSCLTETGSVIQLCKQEPLPDMGAKVFHEVNGGLHGQELSCETTKSVGLSSCGRGSKIDLNEDVIEQDWEYLGQSGKETVNKFEGSVSKPKAVMAKPGIPLDFLAPKVKKEGNVGGWMGSTKTSAFQPTSIAKNCIKNKALSTSAENDSEMPSVVKMIDLNLAATGADFDVESLEDKSAVTELSFPSNMEMGSSQARKLDIDLNCVSGNDDDCHQSPLSTSLPRHSVRDFDLNDNPTSVDTCSVACPPSQGTQALKRMGSDCPPVFSVENSKHQDLRSFRSPYSTDLFSMPGFIPGHVQPFLVAAPNMLPSNEQLQRVAFLQPQLPYAQPPLNAFRIDPKDGASSTVGSHTVLPYVVDPRATAIISQVLGSGGVSAFPNHVFQVPHGSNPDNIAITRPNLDAYNGVNVNRGANAGQLCMPSSNLTLEEQMRSFQQVSVPAAGTKRREPEGGWDSPQFSFRQRTSWR